MAPYGDRDAPYTSRYAWLSSKTDRQAKEGPPFLRTGGPIDESSE